jgi:exopolysaccharide biosynthesis protein
MKNEHKVEKIEILDFDDLKPKKKIKNNDKKKNIWCVVLGILDVIAICFLIMFYGPWDEFRNFWITSSMKTMTHRYLARTLYSADAIKETLNKNYVETINQNTNASEISFSDNKDTGVYDSFYEEQILKRDEGNDLYKYFKIQVNNTYAHITVIYDPSRISYAISSKINVGGQLLTSLAKEQGAIIAMNASGFSIVNKKLVPTGVVIKDSQILYKNGEIGGSIGLIGFNKDNVLVLTTDSPEKAIEDGMRDAMTFGPFLYVNGKAAKISGNGGWGYAPRSVIAQRKDGIVLFIVFDGRNLTERALGASMNDLIDILTRYKAYNAANLDGGGSSTLVINNEVINRTGGWSYNGDRYLPDAWIVK